MLPLHPLQQIPRLDCRDDPTPAAHLVIASVARQSRHWIPFAPCRGLPRRCERHLRCLTIYLALHPFFKSMAPAEHTLPTPLLRAAIEMTGIPVGPPRLPPSNPPPKRRQQSDAISSAWASSPRNAPKRPPRSAPPSRPESYLDHVPVLDLVVPALDPHQPPLPRRLPVADLVQRLKRKNLRLDEPRRHVRVYLPGGPHRR